MSDVAERAERDDQLVTLRPWLTAAAVVVVSGLAMVIALIAGGGAWRAPAAGLPDAGAAVGWALPIARLAALVLGVLTVAGLLYAGVLGPQGRDGVVSRQGRAALLRAAWASLAWAGMAVILSVLTLASVLALPLTEVLTPSVFLGYAWELESSHTLLLTAIVATLIGVGALLTTSVIATVGWLVAALVAVAFPALSGHAAGLGDHALAITSSVLHQVAATVWVAGVVALLGAAWRRDPQLQRTTSGFSALALWTVAVLALSGVLSAMTRMDTPGQLLSTSYGLVLTAKIIVLGVLLAIAARLRQRLVPRVEQSRIAFVQLLVLEVALLAIAMGLAVSLARTPPPRSSIDLLTPAEQLLGYPFPGPPTAASLIFGWRPDAFFLIVGLLAASLYVAGVMRLRARGDRWPIGRTISWLLGVGVIIWATNSGLAAYSPLSFSLHMMQHMSMSMLAPILLVLGGPFTLALRAIPPAPHGQRGPRELLVWGLHSWLARFFTNPIVVLLLYTVGLYGLYYTELFGTLMSTHVGHVLMGVHFILSGYLFYWVVIGVDPLPRPLPHWGKLLLVLVAMVIHSFFALPMMSSSTPIGAAWFSQVQPPWLPDLLADTTTGGGIAWGFGEIPAVIVLVALSVQWARDDSRTAARRDRQAARDGDAELEAYNARLARIAAADAERERREASR